MEPITEQSFNLVWDGIFGVIAGFSIIAISQCAWLYTIHKRVDKLRAKIKALTPKEP